MYMMPQCVAQYKGGKCPFYAQFLSDSVIPLCDRHYKESLDLFESLIEPKIQIESQLVVETKYIHIRGVVYYMFNPETGVTKIGYTERPLQRMKWYRKNHIGMFLAATELGSFQLETERRHLFEYESYQGREWFITDQNLYDFMLQIRDMNGIIQLRSNKATQIPAEWFYPFPELETP